jgi:hypothetical protein
MKAGVDGVAKDLQTFSFGQSGLPMPPPHF